MFTASEYNAARDAVISEQRCSISFIQRKLRIGYNRAAYLVEALQNEGIVSVPDSAGRMIVLVKRPQQEAIGSEGGVMSDLKPCPFCGGVVKWCDCGNCPRITCPKCGQFDLVKAGETLEGAKQEAETTWNNRPFEQRLAAAESKIPRWIPVKERLPKPGDTILAVDISGDMGVCTFVNAKFVGECFGLEAYLDDGGWDCSPSKVIGEYVTHWMPLPEVPESGKGE